MSAAPDSTAPPTSFLERFLEERSIKWMLGLGMLVLLGSSLKFVTAHWESYSPFWKYFVLIAYTAVMYGLAEVGLHRLMLKRTGTGLLALTLSLLPLTFLALRWVAPQLPDSVSGLMHDVGLGSLLVVNLAFTAYASRRILQTLLRQVPTTYWWAYLTLCVSGALAPAVPAALAPVAAVVLWTVFTVGVVKVNRHVFWLAEEERWPRIFALFPTVLLAAQFLTVFVLNFGSTMALSWWGLGLALVAVPVLMTADAAAWVFQQRTGELVFPWPTTVIGPLVVGLVTCLAALALAMTDLPRPIALTPTAALCAICFGAVARRTHHRLFAWATLLCLLTAYQFTPVYFQAAAKQVVQTSAEMVSERRLPYAFYAITYAPFIIGLIVAGRRLKSDLFAVPCRQFALGLSTLMLMASWTDPKAVFIAGAMLTVLWTIQRFAFRAEACRWGVGIAWLSTACGLTVFLRDICHIPLSTDFSFFAITAAAGVLSLIHRVVPVRGRDANSPGVYEFLGTATLCLLVAGWLGTYAIQRTTDGTVAVIPMVCLLAVHHRARVYPLLGDGLLLLAGGTALRYGMAIDVDPIVLTLISSVILVTSWAAARSMSRDSSSMTVRAFRPPLLRVTTAGLVLTQMLLIASLVLLPDYLLTPAVWIALALVTTWSFLAAGRTLPVVWVHVACVSVLLAVTRGLFDLCDDVTALEWLAAVWAVTVLVGNHLLQRLASSSDEAATRSVARHVDGFAMAVEVLLACGTLASLTWPARLAAVAVLVHLVLRARRQSHPLLLHAVTELSFLQVGVGLLSCVTPAESLGMVSTQTWLGVHAVGTFLAALWLTTLRTPRFHRFTPDKDLLHAQTTFWEIATAISTFSLLATLRAPLSLIEIGAVICLFSVLTLDRFRTAVRTIDPEAVWIGLGTIAMGYGYLVVFSVLPLNSVITLGIGLAAGFLFSTLARSCRQSENYAVFAQPFGQVGFTLPAVVALISAMGSFFHLMPIGTGMHSLLILGTAMYYFIRWLEARDQTSLLMATAIFNVSQMLLWHELSWIDPQLYLMPLGLSLIGLAEGLPRELRADLKTMLRYAGALVILLSPLFHILDGSWLPLLTLMAASLGISVLSLGLRSRPLLYSGTAFLVADLVALVIRGSLERTDVLWVVGIALGTSVIALAAYCENHRELVVQRLRMLSATLQTWA